MKFPLMVAIRQELAREPLEDPRVALGAGLDAAAPGWRPAEGGRVAIAVGSRKIERLVELVELLADRLGAAGCRPFIIPAMGSHGGATAEGQERVLGSLGVSEETTGAPVESSMEVIALGETPGGAAAFIDRMAMESDAIVVINRVGPHTGYSGPVQSGVVKMLAVGLGKAAGAGSLHRHGFASGHLIGEMADLLLEKAPPVLAVALVEDGTRRLSRLEVLAGVDIRRREPGLLEAAVSMWPGIPLDAADLLIVEELGKDISGVGMDPLVTGRGKTVPEGARFAAKRLVALSLTPGSLGNATGVGHADIITERLLRAIDFEVMRKNVMTSGALERARIPLAAGSDRDAVSMALESLGCSSPREAKVVRIKNTRELSEFQASIPLALELKDREGITVGAEASEMAFDSRGTIR